MSEVTLGPCRLILGDCLEVLPTLEGIDAVITDPPYGIAYQRSGGGRGPQQGRRKTWDKIIGDDNDFDPTPWLDVAPTILFWGANHFARNLPRGRWLAWNKLGHMEPWDSFSDVEFAWVNERGADRIYSLLWKGLAQADKEDNGTRYHPTMKPVRLMWWCMEEAKIKPGATVVDPYMGSGTTGIACIRTGRNFIGIEKDPQHFRTACDRIERELSQLTLPL